MYCNKKFGPPKDSAIFNAMKKTGKSQLIIVMRINVVQIPQNKIEHCGMMSK